MKTTLTISRWLRFGVLLSVLLTGVAARGQHVSLRNNLLYDALLTPNVGIDVSLSDRWSLGAVAGFRPWPTDDAARHKLRHLLLAPELRFWQSPQSQLRLPRADSLYRSHAGYWGLNLVYSHYNVGGVRFPLGLYQDVRNRRLQGDLGAVGLFYGHTWRLSRLLRLEAEAGIGVGYSHSEQYHCGQCGTKLADKDKVFLVPKLALNIVLDRQQREQPADNGLPATLSDN